MDSQEELQDLMSQLGGVGKYQYVQTFLHSLAWFLASIHMMGFVFVFPLLDHRCYIKEIDDPSTNTIHNVSDYIPTNSKGNLESCLKFDNFTYYSANQTMGYSTTSCNSQYVYNSSYFPDSRIQDWDMVCDKKFLRALLQSIFLFGTLTGAFLGGIYSDRFGRKPIFCISGMLQCLFGIACVYLDNYIAFSLSMFLYGLFGGSGAVVPSVALTMELVSASKRNLFGTLFTFWFGLGAIVVALWAYFLPEDVRLLELIYALHAIVLFGHWWLMDESICWLWTNGQKEKAIKIAEKAVKCNGKQFINRYTRKAEQQLNVPISNSDKPPTYSALDLFRYPKLRQRTLVMLYCWFACNLTYFGLSFNSVNLFGNPYFMFIINILVEMPAHLIVIFLAPKTGNKIMTSASMLLTGVACIVASVLPYGSVTTSITMVAKVTATISFDVINSYTAELFPTVLRNTAIGLCVMAARSGASVIPEINLLATAAEEIPSITFGTAGILASMFALFLLPETMNQNIPQTIEDVEKPAKEVEEESKTGSCFSAFF